MPLQPAPVEHLTAPAHWRTIDFVSDLHLQHPDTTWETFAHYMQHTPADAIFLLGDIFEIWVGDDALHSPGFDFEHQVAQVLCACSRTKSLYFMHGNRDFLVGQDFCRAAGVALLHDPCMLALHTASPQDRRQRILLSHGDALCIDDTAYMQFRHMVRNPQWQQAFLQKPLAERTQMARHLRQQSQARKNAFGSEGYADVDTAMAQQWLQQHGCTVLLHGHTHKPATHVLPTPSGATCQRIVLSDWDMLAPAPRAEIVRLSLPANSATHATAATWSRIDLTHE